MKSLTQNALLSPATRKITMSKEATDNIVPLIGGKCPTCGSRPIQAFRPFCSKRCADLDLARWFNEDYRIPEEQAADQHDDTYDGD